MTNLKRDPFTKDQRERLIIALLLEDALDILNGAIKKYGLSFLLDYGHDHSPRLFVHAGHYTPEQILYLDPRKHCCFISVPKIRLHQEAYLGMVRQLGESGVTMRLVNTQIPNGPRIAKLQLLFKGAGSNAITLMEVRKGNSLTETSFEMPKPKAKKKPT